MTTFAVIDGRSQTVWKMSAPPPSVRSAEDVVYGRVPAGFTQEVPGGGAPRPMIPGEKLLVVIVTPEYVYRAECEGRNAPETRCGSWQSARPEPGTIERALRGERIGGTP